MTPPCDVITGDAAAGEASPPQAPARAGSQAADAAVASDGWPAAAITVRLPCPSSIEDLRRALRRLHASDRVIGIRLRNRYGVVWLTELDEVEIAVDIEAAELT